MLKVIKLINNFVRNLFFFESLRPNKIEKLKKYRNNKFFVVIPRKTYIIDLTKDEKEIESKIRKKERWGYRKAKKLGVSLEIVFGNKLDKTLLANLEDLFINFTNAKKLPLSIIKLNKQNLIYLAKLNNNIVGFSIVNISNEYAGLCKVVSDESYKKYQIVSFLYYSMIFDLKRRGIKKFDLGGIASNIEIKIDKRRENIKKFKSRWGGNEVITQYWVFNILSFLLFYLILWLKFSEIGRKYFIPLYNKIVKKFNKQLIVTC